MKPITVTFNIKVDDKVIADKYPNTEISDFITDLISTMETPMYDGDNIPINCLSKHGYEIVCQDRSDK